MSAHTKGTWMVFSVEGCSPMVISPGIHDICMMCGSSSNESVMDDARLIAAAPDMLAALEYVCSYRGEVPTHIADVCSIAIAAAKEA